jgi:alkaline phosphatase
MHSPTEASVSSLQPTRRRFLQGSLAALAGLGLGKTSSLAGEGSAPARSGGKVKNIIFCVSDGMSAGAFGLADAFSRSQRKRGTSWIELQNAADAVGGLMETYSLNSLVTDSAAASSAWGCGQRVNNGSINILPDGTSLESIAQRFRAAGKKVGVVTTATVTHATPAGFVVQIDSRQKEEEIAEQYLDRVDLALGGGAKFFDPSRRTDGFDLAAAYAKSGFQVCRTLEELEAAAAPGSKLLGIFAQDHLPYSIDQMMVKEVKHEVPTLAQMTQAALTSLADQGHGFLLQIEGARIDHAAHQNDIATLLWDQLAFDDAVQVAWDFARANPDTLLIVTTDHGNSNPGLNSMGDSKNALKKVNGSRASFEALAQQAQKMEANGELNAASWTELMRNFTGITPSPAEAEILCAAVARKPVSNWNKQLANYWGLMGQITGNHTGVGWTGTTHTADPVILNAWGPGADEFTGYVKNFEICGKLCQLAGVQFAPVTS